MEEQKKEGAEAPGFRQEETLQTGALQAAVSERSFADGPTQSAQVLQVPAPEYHKRGIREKDPEFIVAVMVFSILGGALVLAALVLFGIYYMTDFFLGMCLYAFTLLVILISELLVRKRLPKLSLVLTSIGIGGVYVSTYVNSSGGLSSAVNSIYYRYHDKVLAWIDPESVWDVGLNNFSVRTGVFIAAIFTLAVFLYGWKRHADLYRMVGLLFCYLCIRPGGGWATGGQLPAAALEFVVLGSMVLILNLIHALMPTKQKVLAYFLPMAAFPLVMEGLYSYPYFDWLKNDQVGNVSSLVYLSGVLFVTHLYLYRQLKAFEQEGKNGSGLRVLVLAAYVIGLMVLYHLFMYGAGTTMSDIMSDTYRRSLSLNNLPALLFSMISVGAMGLICFMVLNRYKEKWVLFYFGIIMFYQVSLAVRDYHYPDNIANIWYLLGLFVMVRLMSLLKVKAVRGADAVLTLWICAHVLELSDKWYSYMLLAALMLGFFAVNYWHAYYELLVTYTLAFFVMKDLPLILKPLVFVGVLFVGILVVNHVKWIRGKYPVVYNALVLVGQALSYFVLLGYWYRNSYVTHLCMLVLGLGIIALVLQERYQLKCRHQLLIAELFLSYMILVMRLRYSFTTSILLMSVAVLVGVAGGFLMNQKSARICGLILSILVCGKIVLYDFSGGPVEQRIFLFLAVGVLALMIVGIYIVLEKRTQKKSIKAGEEV